MKRTTSVSSTNSSPCKKTSVSSTNSKSSSTLEAPLTLETKREQKCIFDFQNEIFKEDNEEGELEPCAGEEDVSTILDLKFENWKKLDERKKFLYEMNTDCKIYKDIIKNKFDMKMRPKKNDTYNIVRLSNLMINEYKKEYILRKTITGFHKASCDLMCFELGNGHKLTKNNENINRKNAKNAIEMVFKNYHFQGTIMDELVNAYKTTVRSLSEDEIKILNCEFLRFKSTDFNFWTNYLQQGYSFIKDINTFNEHMNDYSTYYESCKRIEKLLINMNCVPLEPNTVFKVVNKKISLRGTMQCNGALDISLNGSYIKPIKSLTTLNLEEFTEEDLQPALNYEIGNQWNPEVFIQNSYIHNNIAKCHFSKLKNYEFSYMV